MEPISRLQCLQIIDFLCYVYNFALSVRMEHVKNEVGVYKLVVFNSILN